jgi:hypothetical protein
MFAPKKSLKVFGFVRTIVARSMSIQQGGHRVRVIIMHQSGQGARGWDGVLLWQTKRDAATTPEIMLSAA